MIFTEKLNQLRREKGLSQEQLAEKLNVSRQAVSKWETGEAQPDMNKLLLLCDAFEVSMDELCGKETKTETEKKNPSLNNRKKFNWLCLVFLAVGLLLGFAGGYLGHKAVQSSLENGYIFDNIKITDFSFTYISAGDNSKTIQIRFSPSISNNNLKYQVVRTDNDGNSITYDAEYNAGVCKCTVNLDYFSGYTLTAAISDGKNIYTAGLIKFDTIKKEGLSSQELWNK